MKIVYERINDMRGNLITVNRHRMWAWASWHGSIYKMGGNVYASVLRIEGDQVTLQVFQNTRGISTNDKVTFLKREMQATMADKLLGRRLKRCRQSD